MRNNKNGNGFVGNLSEEKIARALGWFSLGLGLAQLLAPRRVSRAIGISDQPTLMRLIGVRELASGIGILTQPNPAGWLQARVGGDLMDLALLGLALAAPGTNSNRVAVATAAVAGVTALDTRVSRNFSENPGANIVAIHVTRTVTINRPAEELYQFWRNFENLPRFMNHLESVRILDDQRSHWVAKGPARTSVEWDAEIINERTNELVAWRSAPGSQVDNAGTVRFEPAPGDRGTIVKVELQYTPPAGVIGATVARLFGESPQKQIAIDLFRFKQLMETGEIARTEGQPAGRKRSTSRKYDDFVRT